MADDEKLPLLTSGSTVVGHLPIYQSPRETYIDQQPLPQNGYFNSISQTDTIEPVSLSWENINVYVREKKKKITVDAERLTAGTHNVNTSKQILQNGKCVCVCAHAYLYAYTCVCVLYCKFYLVCVRSFLILV